MLAAMAARTINGIDELRSLVGEHLGYSDWVEITQDQVNQFAEATGDHQWIHVDVERAKAGPFGGADRPRLPDAVARPGAVAAGRTQSTASRWASTTAPTRSASRRRCRSARSCASASSCSRSRRRRRHPDEAGVLLRGRGRAEAVVRRRGAVPPVRVSAPWPTPGAGRRASGPASRSPCTSTAPARHASRSSGTASMPRVAWSGDGDADTIPAGADWAAGLYLVHLDDAAPTAWFVVRGGGAIVLRAGHEHVERLQRRRRAEPLHRRRRAVVRPAAGAGDAGQGRHHAAARRARLRALDARPGR